MRRLTPTLLIAAALLAVSAPAAAAAASRAEYVAQADPICKRADKRALKEFEKVDPPGIDEVDGDSSKASLRRLYRQLAKQIAKTNKIYAGMIDDVSAVVPAPGDEAGVAEWIDGMRDAKRISDGAARAWRRAKVNKGYRLLSESTNALIGGARYVNGYGFKYCPGGEVVTGDYGYAQESGS